MLPPGVSACAELHERLPQLIDQPKQHAAIIGLDDDLRPDDAAVVDDLEPLEPRPPQLGEHALLAHRTSVIRQDRGEENREHGETQPTRFAHHLHPAKKKQAAEIATDRPDQ